MLLLLVLSPLVAAAAAGLLGRFVGSRGASLLTVLSMAMTTALSYTVFFTLPLHQGVAALEVAPWIDSGMIHLAWGLYVDSLSATMLLVVTTVSLVVHMYSIGYMSEDPHRPRFMAYLSLFTFFMLVLVTGDSLVTLFIGWEGVGLCSYLLIGFWFTRIEASKAAMKAVIVNKVGDYALVMSMGLAFMVFQSLNGAGFYATALAYSQKPVVLLGLEVDAITLVCLAFFVGAVAKSAQIGLHTWLPDAMD